MSRDDRHGYSDEERAEHLELHALIAHVTRMPDPRLAFLVTDEGHIHFATTLDPQEAAAALESVAAKVRRYGVRHVSEHLGRSNSAVWN